jgi:hypothetical protein
MSALPRKSVPNARGQPSGPTTSNRYDDGSRRLSRRASTRRPSVFDECAANDQRGAVVSDDILRYIDHPACGRIDMEEVLRGRATGKPCEKFVAFDDMFAAADGGVAC